MNRLPKSMLFLVLAAVMISCDGIVGYTKQMMKIDNGKRSYNDNQEVADDTIHFVIDSKNQMLLKASINGVEDTVLYDTGCSAPAILIYTQETKPEGMKFYRVPLMGADKKTKMKLSPVPVHIETPMCIVDHFGNAMLLEKQAHSCDKEPDISAHNILGFSGLDYTPFSIDFTNNRIYSMRKMSEIDTTEYFPVKSRLDEIYKVLFVYPIINGIEYECIFDTGNSGGILIKDEQKIDNHADVDLLYEGSIGMSIGGLTEKQRFVIAAENTIEFAGQKDTIPVIYLGNNLTSNNVGLQYIRRFDWIVGQQVQRDENQVIVSRTIKLYAKPHVSDTEKLHIEYPVSRYGVTTTDGTLKIAVRLLDGQERFELGDQIVSVDGEDVTDENICYYYDLLTETKDWSVFDIQVK